jgi:hypothetical protein
VCRDSQVQQQEVEVQYTVAGLVPYNYFEERCYNRPPCCYRTDRCRIRGHHPVQDHGHPRNALGDPDPDPSGAVGHRHVQLDLDHGLALVPALERE